MGRGPATGIGLLIASMLLGLTPGAASAADPGSLRKWIALRFPGLSWVAPAELAAWLERPDGSRPLLLDARSASEYDVSHLEGAIRVDPDAPADALAVPDTATEIVVYCSVGYRSAAVAKRLQARDVRIYNLEGGIFLWANQGRAVVRDGQPVRAVHPYGGGWARYLDESLRASE